MTENDSSSMINKITPGSIIRFNSGMGSPDYFGVLVERNETQWGTKHKVVLNDGREHFASTIYSKENMPLNGSGIGAFLVE
jgi:hypothetical protein